MSQSSVRLLKRRQRQMPPPPHATKLRPRQIRTIANLGRPVIIPFRKATVVTMKITFTILPPHILFTCILTMTQFTHMIHIIIHFLLIKSDALSAVDVDHSNYSESLDVSGHVYTANDDSDPSGATSWTFGHLPNIILWQPNSHAYRAVGTEHHPPTALEYTHFTPYIGASGIYYFPGQPDTPTGCNVFYRSYRTYRFNVFYGPLPVQCVLRA